MSECSGEKKRREAKIPLCHGALPALPRQSVSHQLFILIIAGGGHKRPSANPLTFPNADCVTEASALM